MYGIGNSMIEEEKDACKMRRGERRREGEENDCMRRGHGSTPYGIMKRKMRTEYGRERVIGKKIGI